MFTYSRYKQSRNWGVFDPAGELVCICVYKKGAREATRLLNGGK